MDLFDATDRAGSNGIAADAPLAERIRPRTLQEVLGHERLMGQGGPLAAALAQRELPSLIFWGPPGCGKTTVARALSRVTDAHFEPFSAVLGGVKEVRLIVARAKERRRQGLSRTMLFVDEIHRFNKSQQDAFLPHVEDGTLILIGATTENPSFSLNAALLSRSRVIRLEPLSAESLEGLLRRALTDVERGLGAQGVSLSDEVIGAIASLADGDARRALTDLELVVGVAAGRNADAAPVALDEVAGILGARTLRHDRAGDGHYDVSSAFIKSLRGSDPDAALYYMARLIEAGDDPRFICRRLVIFASEDIGNADPRALGVAVDCMNAYAMIGMPEGRIILGQCCTYLACAPKSNASYLGINQALAVVKQTGTLPVPMHLRNAPTALMKQLGAGKGYQYPHDHGGWVPEVYLPDALAGRRLYEPTDNGYERHLKARLDQHRDIIAQGRPADRSGEPN